MARFHTLDVVDVQPETRDAVVVTLKPRNEDKGTFDFIQGQYLTFRREFDGEELRRSYSICSGRDEGVLKVGIKRVDGGAFSTWANENLSPGQVMEAMPPMGNFHTPIEPGAEKQYLGFAGGSGITPLLSIIKTVLSEEPGAEFTLVYANRQVNTIMFREELDDLKNRFLGRFSMIHVLESDSQDIDLFTGRVDEEKCAALFKNWIDPKAVDTAFICGPEPMMLGIAKSLREHGLADEQIKFELFASGQPGRAKVKAKSERASESGATAEVTITLDGATRTVQMPKEGQSLLEAALEANMDAPYACKAGVCSTCRAKVVEGETEMVTNHALEDYEVRQGYVLTCQCYPVDDKIVLSYDE
ncbi:2Fe-2S iron-sulfur cluster-binding protein [Roseibium sp.]|uniref:2Fe-2S iron-sulfur cluster-binding protein n=1 Tax=Roseibium sp. TaxID=1936156 RepID=UPI003A97086B